MIMINRLCINVMQDRQNEKMRIGLRQKGIKDTLCSVQPVFRFIKNNTMQALDYLIRYLEAPVRRKAVHEDVVTACVCNQF